MNSKIDYIYSDCLGYEHKYDYIWIDDRNVEIDIRDDIHAMNLIGIWAKKGNKFFVNFNKNLKLWEIEDGFYSEYLKRYKCSGENLYEVVINAIYQIELNEEKSLFEYDLNLADTYA